MIVLVAQQRDLHANVVRSHLERRGEPVFIADLTELGRGAELSFCPASAELSEWRRSDGATLRLGEARVAWYRPKGTPVTPPEVDVGSDRQLIAREWAELLRGTFAASGLPMINPLHAAAAATKPYQLAAAVRAGLSVPETLVTNDAAQVRAFVVDRPGDVVHKILTTNDGLLATKRYDEADARQLEHLAVAPTIFQRRVSGTRELRITVAGERVFTAAFDTSLVDGRMDRAVTYVPHLLPPSVERALLALLERLELPYATVDMRIDAEGEYQFLEVNPEGQFLWIEIRTGMPISAAVADLLVETAQRG